AWNDASAATIMKASITRQMHTMTSLMLCVVLCCWRVRRRVSSFLIRFYIESPPCPGAEKWAAPEHHKRYSGLATHRRPILSVTARIIFNI
ncbi:MAG: hypothetical protein WBW31_17675, partial [Candidatus Sulfotelmatobacter sp.]